jgi:hypothetical protein
MKKLFIITVFMALAMNGFTQQPHFDFAETVESGQTLYFLKGHFDNPYDLMVTYPCHYGDETYYYGYEEPSGDLVIPSTITHNDTVYTITGIGYKAFWHCSNITSISLPNTLSVLQQGAFASCTGISGEVVIPDLVTVINSDAFRWCSNLTSVVFSSALGLIGSSAFQDCLSLEHISSFPESLLVIYESAFEHCIQLSGHIVIPSHLKIKDRAFANCGITSVTFSEGVTSLAHAAFLNCPITSIYIPSTVTSISGRPFSGCAHINTIVVDPENLVYDSRDNCNALIETSTNTLLIGGANTIIPNTVSIIGTYAFCPCIDLYSITIPNSVERIEYGAFNGCNHLTTLTFPSSVSYIDDRAICCSNLTSITCKSSTPPTAFNRYIENGIMNTFLGTPHETPIYVPIGTSQIYRHAEGWNWFSNFIESEMNLEGEWYYEIQNDDGTITYQHLEYAADTTINNERPKVIVRSNTQYDRDTLFTTVTHEYVYEDNGKVYWWNKDLQEFTVLYDLAAQTGDEWEIKVGTESLIMHVDSVEYIDYDGQSYRALHVSDVNNLFTGDIVCNFGHMTSFFPEKLMNRNASYTVDGLRCYWVGDALLYHNGDEDCDAIYSEIHSVDANETKRFAVYPNPTNDILVIETQSIASLPNQTYRITNLVGQTVLSGSIIAEKQQINIANLPEGMYFITVGGQTVKFVVK